MHLSILLLSLQYHNNLLKLVANIAFGILIWAIGNAVMMVYNELSIDFFVRNDSERKEGFNEIDKSVHA